MKVPGHLKSHCDWQPWRLHRLSRQIALSACSRDGAATTSLALAACPEYAQGLASRHSSRYDPGTGRSTAVTDIRTEFLLIPVSAVALEDSSFTPRSAYLWLESRADFKNFSYRMAGLHPTLPSPAPPRAGRRITTMDICHCARSSFRSGRAQAQALGRSRIQIKFQFCFDCD